MYVARNEQGHIVALYANPQRENHEWVDGAELYVAPEQIAEQRIAKYQRRIAASTRLIAEFAAENEERLTSGEWTEADLQSVLADPQIADLLRLLQAASFQTAVTHVQGMTGPLYTDELKAAWVAKIEAAL